MRFITRAQLPDDSPAPGIIPGTVYVHNRPDPAARPSRTPESPTPPRGSRRRPPWSIGRGHRP